MTARRSSTRIRRAGVSIGALAVAFAATPATAGATWAGKPGLIAYAGAGDGHEIRLVRPDGTGDRLLTTANAVDVAWSRNGKELAYWDYGTGLVRIRPDGTHRHVILPQAAFSGEAPLRTAWSPDGRRISFTIERDFGPVDDLDNDTSTEIVYVVRRDGTHLHKLVHGFDAVWLPHRHRLVYGRPDGRIAEIKPNGRGRKVIARHKGFSGFFDLSPSGRRLVYIFWNDRNGNPRFRTLNLKTGRWHAIPRRRLPATDVAWTPRGGRLAYAFSGSDADGTQSDEIRTARRDGTHSRHLLDLPPMRYWPSGIAWQTR